MSNELIAAIATSAAAGLVGLAFFFWKEKKETRLRTVSWAVAIAYNITNEVAKMTPNAVDDKVAYALGVFKDALAVRGYSPSDGDTEAAKLEWQALHGQEKIAEGIANP